MYTVLYVEEDERLREQVKGYRFWQESEFALKKMAESGAEALSLLEKGEFDVVITDIRTSAGKGTTLAEAMRQMNYAGALVLLGSSCSFEAAREGMHLGALDFIPRPAGERKVMETLTGIAPELGRRTLRGREKRGRISESQIDELYEELLEKEGRGAGLEKKMEEILSLLEKKCEEEKERKEEIDEIFKELKRRMGRDFPWLLKLDAGNSAGEGQREKREADWKQEALTRLGRMEEMAKSFRLERIDETVNRILGGMAAHLGEGACLIETADELELSRDYVRILFKQRMNMGQNEYLTMMRMEYGKVLLKGTNLKVYQVAERTGYGTIDYFSRLFKAYTGMTPARFRKDG